MTTGMARPYSEQCCNLIMVKCDQPLYFSRADCGAVDSIPSPIPFNSKCVRLGTALL